MTDPRYSDQHDPVLSRDQTDSGVWGWVAGLAILALIAFVVIAGWNSDKNTASTGGPSNAPATANAPRSPPSTTGAGSTAPQPMTPAPATPSNRGTQ